MKSFLCFFLLAVAAVSFSRAEDAAKKEESCCCTCGTDADGKTCGVDKDCCCTGEKASKKECDKSADKTAGCEEGGCPAESKPQA